MTGREFINAFLMVSGFPRKQIGDLTENAWSASICCRRLIEKLERTAKACASGFVWPVDCASASVLILDEPLNGLDPMVRAETIALFRQLAADGLHLIISSHILHEVDMMSDRVVLLNNGYVVAEGAVHGVRDEMDVEHPMQILIRCDQPSLLRRACSRRMRWSKRACTMIAMGCSSRREIPIGSIFCSTRSWRRVR